MSISRYDRKFLRRNRSAVSWLSILCVILAIWLNNLYSDIDNIRYDNLSIKYDLEEYKKISIEKSKKIDSLIKVLNKPNIEPVDKKIYKPVIKKDTTYHRVDSVKTIKKDTILKDSVK